LDICIISQGPRLGFISARDREKGQYTAGLMSLSGADRRILTADFSYEGLKLLNYLGYDPALHAFVMRGWASSVLSDRFVRIMLSDAD